MKRIFAGLGVLVVLTLVRPDTALAHGGTEREVASNYRTRITSVPADIEGLDVNIIDIDGTVELDWRGSGELIVLGYEDEPYLRFTADGVETNLRSPATYLNQDRYANVAEPEIADAAAEPMWQRTSDQPIESWHDHRTHWMSPIPPAQVDSNPDDTYVIFERWEIPIRTSQGPAVVAGDLAWIPPPPVVSWLPPILIVGGLGTLAAFSRRGSMFAAALAALGSLSFTVDVAAFVVRSPDNLSNRIWTFAYPTVVAISAARLSVHYRRGTDHPPLSMMTAGLVLFLMGGVDRFDTLTNSQLFSAGPAWIPRTAVILSFAAGLALMIRFLTFLVPVALGRPLPATRHRDSLPPNHLPTTEPAQSA